MKQKERIELLAELGHFLRTETENAELQLAIRKSEIDNPWFTPENSQRALHAISECFLQKHALENWLHRYSLADHPHPQKSIGLVMAGNIPLVGFHDWLCVFAAGQRAIVKLSDKDRHLLPFLIKKMGEWQFESWEYTQFLSEGERLAGIDAVIATGTNNTARYFEQYFGKYPHIIRKNRNGVAVLDGTESDGDLLALGNDVFSFFGLGCRNVSKIYVPHGYNFDRLLEILHEYRDIILHNKYKNNFDYNFTLYILNKIPHLNNGCILLKEDASLTSRIASLHYEFYENLTTLQLQLKNQLAEIQCIATKLPLQNLPTISLGKTQSPSLSDYPDGVDVMDFLLSVQSA